MARYLRASVFEHSSSEDVSDKMGDLVSSLEMARNSTNTSPLAGATDTIGIQPFALILLCAAAIFSVTLLGTLCFLLEKHRNDATSPAARSAASARSEPETPEERYRNIEKWLVNKKAHPHDHVCELIMQSRRWNATAKRGMKPEVADDDSKNHNRARTLSTQTCVTEENEGSLSHSNDEEECPICFEVFEENDIVSWSPETCSHRCKSSMQPTNVQDH